MMSEQELGSAFMRMLQQKDPEKYRLHIQIKILEAQKETLLDQLMKYDALKPLEIRLCNECPKLKELDLKGLEESKKE